MEIITLEEFIAEIETTFSTYAETNDINRNSIKTWVILCLRKFGKNICEQKETVVNIATSRAVLPENFKSLSLALKITGDNQVSEPKENRKLIIEKQKIENPAQWSNVTMDYFVNYCDTKITTERIYTHIEKEHKWYDYKWLSLRKGIKQDVLDVKCLNMHPSIRNSYSDIISITGRTLNTNFETGKIYIQYNSLPSDEEGEIAIPFITTGDILEYIRNYVKIRLAEDLSLNQKSNPGLEKWASVWMQQDRVLEISARSEANWSGLSKGWENKYARKNRQYIDQYKLPK